MYYMRLRSKVKFANPKIKECFYELQKGDKSSRELFNNINKALDNIEENAFCGIQMSKKLIPREYIRIYDIDNLWKYNLPKGWRLIYSIGEEDIYILALILDWFSHKEYEKKFNYLIIL
jgi:hypothetical protein